MMITSYIRTVLLYIVLIAVVRLMGTRQIGQKEPSELVVTMLIANLMSIPMQDGGIPLYSGVMPVLIVLGLELLLSGLSMKSTKIRKWLCGKPVILIENGRMLQNNLRRTGVTLDELTSHLREKDILDLRSVQYAILETNGNLSVFPYPKEKPASAKDAGIQPKAQYLPITIISDGYLSQENLQQADKDEAWVHQALSQYRACVANTWLLTVDKADHIFWLGKENRQ